MPGKYGIQQSLKKLSVKYEPPKIEEPKPPDHVCAPCSREKRVVEAVNYCPDCKEKLCPTCVSQHRKFQILNSHRILGIEAAPVTEQPRLKSETKITEVCPRHNNKVLNLFCCEHDSVGCTACVATDHKTCPEPEYISKVSQGFKKSGSPKEVRDAVQKMKQDVQTLKLKRLGDKKRFSKERDDIIEEIDNWRKNVNEILDRLENMAKENLHEKFSTEIKVINADIKKCDESIGSLDDAFKKISKYNLDEALMFIYTKQDAKQSLIKGEKTIIEVTENIGRETVVFILDESIEEWMKKLAVIGRFEHEQSGFVGSPFGKYDAVVKSDSDKTDYVFNDSANLPDGRTVITDWKNKRVKLLDQNYNVRSHCDVPGMPYSVCDINSGQVAVSLRDEKLIQLISVEKNLKLDKKFKIDEYCRGIAYYNDELYITCGGGEGEIHGQLRVYNLMGELMRVFEEDIQGKPLFMSPKAIVVNNQETRIHVVDSKKGVVTLSNDGKRLVSVFTDSELKESMGLCMDGRGNLFVSGYESNNIIQISAEGKKVGVVLKESDGISQPLSICCHESTNTRLIVTMEMSDTIRVYSLQQV